MLLLLLSFNLGQTRCNMLSWDFGTVLGKGEADTASPWRASSLHTRLMVYYRCSSSWYFCLCLSELGNLPQIGQEVWASCLYCLCPSYALYMLATRERNNTACNPAGTSAQPFCEIACILASACRSDDLLSASPSHHTSFGPDANLPSSEEPAPSPEEADDEGISTAPGRSRTSDGGAAVARLGMTSGVPVWDRENCAWL